MGNLTAARGDNSSALGLFNIAKGFSSTVLGMYNDSLLLSNQTSVTSTTPLFIVGNGDGTGVGQRSNAMVVLKNGDVEVENLIIGEGTKISKQQAGQAIPGSNPGSGFMTYTLTFPTAFVGTPKIVATAKNDPAWNVGDTFLVSVRSITATQVVFNILRVDANSGWNQSLRVDWVAWE